MPRNGANRQRPVERLAFLMRYLGWHIGSPVAATTAGLNRNLGFTIPPGVPDPAERLWRDPLVPELAVVIHASAADTPVTLGFTLRGRGRIAGLCLHSCGTTRAGRLCWTSSLELPPDGPGPGTAELLSAVWSLPGWQAHASFDFEWLEPEPPA